MEAFFVDFGEISDFVGEWAHQPHLGGPYKAGALRPASPGPHLHTPGVWSPNSGNLQFFSDLVTKVAVGTAPRKWPNSHGTFLISRNSREISSNAFIMLSYSMLAMWGRRALLAIDGLGVFFDVINVFRVFGEEGGCLGNPGILPKITKSTHFGCAQPQSRALSTRPNTQYSLGSSAGVRFGGYHNFFGPRALGRQGKSGIKMG